MRALSRFILLPALIGAVPLALAQTPAAAAAPTREALPTGQTNQRIDRIQVEDAGSRVDELRVGGETKTINVQPKTAVPAYEVKPADASGHGTFHREAGPGAAGQRVWKLVDF